MIKTLIPLSLLGLMAAGCVMREVSRNMGSGDKLSFSDLKPDSIPYKTGQLVMSNHVQAIEVESAREGDRVDFRFTTNGVPIETESYQISEGQFVLLAFGSDVFTPGIPLLKFPLEAGDHWTWTGTFGPKENPLEAEGVIETESEPLTLERMGTSDALRVKVTLKFVAEGSAEARRVLQFWFNDKGFVKRQIHHSSTRQP